MPPGVHIRDVREHLFAAAERVLLRDGPDALTSRAVTTEADCAKGVLHRHFADFDDFLAELVYDRVRRIDLHAIELRASTGVDTVAANLTRAVTAVFSPVAVAIVALVTFRDELRTRLRQTWPVGVPLLAEAVTMVSAYLTEERDLGRIAADADVTALAPILVGSGHLLFADRSAPPSPDAIHTMVTTVLAGPLVR